MSQGMTRREFVQKGLTIIAMGATAPSFLTRTALAMGNPFDIAQVTSRPGVPDDNVLVVVQMGGGNDGLNTVIPFGDDAYYRARPRLAVPRNDVIQVTGDLGFHPKMTKLKELMDRGNLAVIQGVGYPNPSRSHFKSMEIWHTADPEGRTLRVGWIGRYKLVEIRSTWVHRCRLEKTIARVVTTEGVANQKFAPVPRPDGNAKGFCRIIRRERTCCTFDPSGLAMNTLAGPSAVI